QNVFIIDATNTPTLVSLRFLGQTSIALPFGLILAISAAIGMLVTSIMVFVLPQIWRRT
ncbi:MAG: hypothetical protein F6K16_38665, partial [Symploca sp. SIO2B6]|nr:hypothetical protein [Symploca sp. SIO2B6]